MSTIVTKKGQPSNYSPRTLETSRRRLGNFLTSIVSLGSPLASSRTRSTSELPELPLKARIYRRGGGTEGELEEQFSELGIVDLRRSNSGGRIKSGSVGMVGIRPKALKTEGLCLTDLPDDLLLTILEHLPLSARQIHTVSLVSRLFFDIAQSPVLWTRLYRSTPGFRLSDSAVRRAVAAESPSPGIWDGDDWIVLQGPAAALRPIYTTPSRPRRGGAPSTPKPASSPADAIPIHYPTLYRSRYTYSRHLRDPSPAHRSHTESLTEHTDAVYCTRSAGPWLFTGSRDRSIRIWRLAPLDEWGQPGKTRLVKTIQDAHAGSVLCLRVELDENGEGMMVTGSSDRTVKVWELSLWSASSEPDVKLLDTLSGHTNGVLDVLLTAKHIVSCSKDCSIRISDRSDRTLLFTLLGHTQPVNALAVSPDGKHIVSGSGDGSWRIWELAGGRQLDITNTSRKGPGLACIAWQDGYIISGDNARKVNVYSAETGDIIRTLTGHTDLVRTVAADKAESLIYSGSYDGAIRMFGIKTGLCVRKITTTPPTYIFSLDLSWNKVFVARQDGAIEIITLVTGLPYLHLMDG